MLDNGKALMMVGLGLAALTGWLGAQWVQPAQAQEGAAYNPKLVCKYFEVDLSNPQVLETADRTSEVGQWIGTREDDGWMLYTVDFETARKVTGYPQGWLQVCLYPGS